MLDPLVQPPQGMPQPMSDIVDLSALELPDASPMQDVTMAQLDAESAQKAAADAELQRERTLAYRINTLFEWCKTHRETYYDGVFNECYNTYRLQVPDERKTGEWRSKINVPYAFSNVEDVIPHLMEGIWGADRPFRVKAECDQELLDGHEKLLYHQVQEQMELEEKWEEYQRQKVLYGTTAAFVGFKVERRKKRMWQNVVNPMDPTQSTPQIMTVEVPSYVGPTFDVIDIYDLYPHPRATRTNWGKMFWRHWRTKKWLEAAGRFKNLDQISDASASSMPNVDTLIGERKYRTGSANMEMQPPGEKLFEVVTMFDADEKKVISILRQQQGLLIEETDYPFFHDQCPIVFDWYTPLPLEFWGMGIVEPSLSLIHEGNTIRNQRRDNVNLIVNAMMEVREGEIDDEEDELVFRPGGVIHSKSGESTRFLQPPMVTQDSHQEESKVAADIGRVTGTSGPLSGQSDPRVSSASGTSLLQKAQLLRLSRAIKREALAFKRVLTQVSALNDQFLPVPDVMSILGPKFFPTYYKQGPIACTIHADIQIQPAGIYANEDVLRQQFVNMLNIVGANPVMAQKANWDYLLKRTFKLHGIEDTGLALNKPGVVPIMEMSFAQGENNSIALNGTCPPAQMEDDYDIHMQVHQAFLEVRPDCWQSIGQHMATHEAAKQQKQAMMAGPAMGMPPGGPPQGPGGQNGPGSAPPGNGGGTSKSGVNPARQSQPTSQNSISAQVSRMAPRR